GTEQYNAGELVPLPDDTAERLLAMDPPAIARLTEPAAPAAPVTTPAPRPKAVEMIAAVKSAADITALLLLQEEEHGHPDGPRKSVVDAIEARFDALGAAEAAAEDGASTDADAVDAEGADDGDAD